MKPGNRLIFIMKIVNKKTYDLIPYVSNARTHSEEQVVQIASSIKEFGFTNPVLIDDEGGVIAGHGRLMAAKKLDIVEVPCIVLKDLSEAQKKAYMIADNRLPLSAGWNFDLLKIEIEGLQDLDFDVGLLGFESEELDDILQTNSQIMEGLTDQDDAPEIPEEPVIINGDVWVMGNHRLMCGDSTNSVMVGTLLGQDKIDLIFSDPPYGVNYGDKNKFLNDYDQESGSRITSTIIGDNLSEEETKELWKSVFSLWSDYLSEVSSYYITSAQSYNLMMMMMIEGNMPVRHGLVWNKNNGVFGRCDYNYKHEPIIYGWKNTHKFYGNGQFKNSVWDIPKPYKSKLHPTMKPVELIENCILNSSAGDQIVADMFGGSGSTLIACEKTGRACRMMEISEHYCDVIVERWQAFTGHKAVHESTGKTFEDTKKERV